MAAGPNYNLIAPNIGSSGGGGGTGITALTGDVSATGTGGPTAATVNSVGGASAASIASAASGTFATPVTAPDFVLSSDNGTTPGAGSVGVATGPAAIVFQGPRNINIFHDTTTTADIQVLNGTGVQINPNLLVNAINRITASPIAQQATTFSGAVVMSAGLTSTAGGTALGSTSATTFSTSGLATLASAAVTAGLTVGTTLGVSGAATLASASVTGTLTAGASTLASASVTGAATVGTTLAVTGTTTLTGQLTSTTTQDKGYVPVGISTNTTLTVATNGQLNRLSVAGLTVTLPTATAIGQKVIIWNNTTGSQVISAPTGGVIAMPGLANAQTRTIPTGVPGTNAVVHLFSVDAAGNWALDSATCTLS